MSRQITSARQVGRFSSIPSGRSLLLLLLLLQITLIVPRLHAQDPSQIMQQLTDLQQQMAGATDPCPFMPKLKALINQIANQSPEVYQAMKPSLDLLNSQDDGCKAIAPDASPEPTATSTANPNPGGKPTGIGTGTAAPPSCVYLSPSQPCVPLAQYNQQQAQIASAPVSVNPPTTSPTAWPAVSTNANFVDPNAANAHICPSVGHILTGHYAENDVWEGESIGCIPGQQVIITWPSPTGAGSSPVVASGGAPGTPGSSSLGGSGGCVNLHQFAVVQSQFLTGTGHCGGEVSVHITNNSNVTLDCSFRFHKNGSWDLNEPSGIVIPPGQTRGGELQGAWTCGADTSDIEDACFAKGSTDNQGHLCSSDVKW